MRMCPDSTVDSAERGTADEASTDTANTAAAAAEARALTNVELNAGDTGDVLAPSVPVAYDDRQAIYGGECSDHLPTPAPEGPGSSAARVWPDHSDANTWGKSGRLLGVERAEL